MAPAAPPIGTLLREWRTRRHLSQLDLAHTAEVSPRHLSFVETGRARPSREMVLHLAEHLEVPLRARNGMLLAAGFAPAYRERGLDDPAMGPIRAALDRILAAHEPWPALVVDRRWELVTANAAAGLLMQGVAPDLLGPPANVLRASLHPDGLGSRIVNLAEWSDHVLGRLRREALISGSAHLIELEGELRQIVRDQGVEPRADHEGVAEPAITLRMRTGTKDGTELAFVATVCTFGTALDVTLSELSIEAFLPADDATVLYCSASAASPIRASS